MFFRFFKLYVIVMVTTLFFGCAEQNLDIGKQHTKSEGHEYRFMTAKDSKELGVPVPAPFPNNNEMKWSKVKDIGEIPDKLEQKFKPYSVFVVESGYAFLQVTQGSLFDDIEWGWKIVLENRSKHDIYAYGGYALLDKDGFVLTKVGKDWDGNEAGVLIKSGTKGTIQGTSDWRVDRRTKPYAAKRVFKGDYKLFLRHNMFEDLLELKQ